MTSKKPNIENHAAKAIAVHMNKWKSSICSSDKLDKDKIRFALAAFYSVHNLPPPSRFLFLDSPISGALAASLISKWTQYRFTPSPVEFLKKVRTKADALIEKSSDKKRWIDTEHLLKKSLSGSFGLAAQDIRQAMHVQLMTGQLQTLQLEGIGYQQREGSLAAILDSLMLEIPDEFKEVLEPLTAKHHSSTRDHNILALADACLHSCSYAALDVELASLDFCANNGIRMPEINPLTALAQSCGWWWAIEDVCVITARPTRLRTNKDGRLHSSQGPAVHYPDTWGIYAWRGQPVPPRFTDFIRNMNSHDITQEPNAELRRMMLDAFGMEAFMLSSGARKVQQDDCGELWKQEMPDDEPLVMVRVTNSTPEPEGHLKKYFIRVPPTIRSAREGVAWTFGMRAQEYMPKKQT